MNLFFPDNLGVIAPGVWLVAGALSPASRPRPPVFLVETPSHECCVTQSPVWRCDEARNLVDGGDARRWP